MNPSLSDEKPNRRACLRWRLLRWTALFTVFWIVAIALFYGVENWRGWREWRIERDALLAKGRPVEIKDFIPPPVPDDQNFALNPILRPLLEYDPPSREGEPTRWHDTNATQRSFAALDFDGRYDSRGQPGKGLWTLGQPIDLAAWQAYFRSPRTTDEIRKARARPGRPPLAVKYQAAEDPTRIPGTPLGLDPGRPAEDVLLGLSMIGEELDVLQKAAALPYSRFPLHYDEGYATLLPHLAKLKLATRYFGLRSVAHLAEDQADRASADAVTALRLAESVTDEPILISQLVRYASLIYALQPVWEGQVRHQWTDPQLATLIAQLQPLRPLADVRRSFHAERAQIALMTQRLIRSQRARIEYAEMISQMRNGDGSPWYAPGGPLVLYLTLAPRGWLYASLAATSRRIEQLATTPPTAIPALRNEPTPEGPPRSLRLFLYHELFLPNTGFEKGLPGSLTKAVRCQVQIELAITACALERHRLAHGEYPPTLEALVPAYLPEVPQDPITAGPLRYKRVSVDRFRVWSVGADGQDDEGKAMAASGDAESSGDWVWGWPEEQGR